MEFVGVTTGSSSIMKLFPLWARELGIDAELSGRDVPLGAPPETYREILEHVRDDDGTLGALVTTHKLAVLAAARDLFDELDANAERLGEVSSISKRDGRLIGHAFDPITSGYALERIGPFDGDVLCLGAGGAGAAIVLHLLSRDRPPRIAVTDTDPGGSRRSPASATSRPTTRPPRASCSRRCRRGRWSSTPPAWARTGPGRRSPTTRAGPTA